MRAMCGVPLKHRKRVKDYMMMLSLNETMDQSALANIVRWHGHVFRREDGHVLRRALEFEVKGRMRGRNEHQRGRNEHQRPE